MLVFQVYQTECNELMYFLTQILFSGMQ